MNRRLLFQAAALARLLSAAGPALAQPAQNSPAPSNAPPSQHVSSSRHAEEAAAAQASRGQTSGAAQTPKTLELLNTPDLQVQAHVQAGVNLVAERNLFWNFAQTVAGNSDYDPDKNWLEGYIKPGLSFSRNLEGETLYGAASFVASGTRGTDAFDARNTGRVTVEELYLGLRSDRAEWGNVDLSFGAREFTAGTGMLIANGGSSGFTRGALKLGPRKAWRIAGLAKFSHKRITGTGFFLDPNEAPDNDTGTHIAGFDLRYDDTSARYLGATLGKVVASRASYPKAAPNGIGPPSINPDARDGLEFLAIYSRFSPPSGPLADAWIAAELALERNDRIDLEAWGGRIEVGYSFSKVPWRPQIAYIYQTFSGDNPKTAKNERFDPLYYEGNPDAWSTGSKSSMVFINSNVNASQIMVRAFPTSRDTLTLRVASIGANQRLSPIQFGQATRLVIEDGIAQPIAGVLRKHLADDWYLEYQRMITPNIYLTAGLSASKAGSGIKSIVPDEKHPLWNGGYINVIINY